MYKIFAVKTLYRSKVAGKPKVVDKYYNNIYDLLEERVVLVKARTFNEAIRKGEKEAVKYASFENHINPYGQKVVQEYIGGIDVFESYDEIKSNGEIYSYTQLIKSSLSNDKISDKIFGKEIKNERKLRKKFCNRRFTGITK